MQRMTAWAAAISLLAIGGCRAGDGGNETVASGEMATTQLTVATASGPAHRFTVEVAATEAQQRQGLMYRPPLAPDRGMLFAPYPPGGGAPRPASFWMRNTPGALDILFIRPDGTIATVAENTVPLSETPVESGEAVSAVLEIAGGRAADLGIAAGDRVTWK